MVTLKVVSYYDTWLKENKKAVLLEKDGNMYDASGLFSKLEKFEINNMENLVVLHEEVVNYYDRSAKEQEDFLKVVSSLEKKYGIKQFGNTLKCKKYWVHVNGVSNIRAYG